MSNEIFDWKSRITVSDTRSTESDDDHIVNDENISLTSSLNKKMMLPTDRLNELPDSLLLHILTFVDTAEAAKTCVLSKRWQFLWSNLPVLKFSNICRGTKLTEFVAGIRRTLASRNSNHLEKFKVVFHYRECCASDVDALVELALKHKVKHVSFNNHNYEDLYMLPQLIYTDSSLTRLSLTSGFHVAPQRNIEWRSLTRLDLKQMELFQHVMEKIFSGCPVLYELNIMDCWGLNCLEINCRSLHALRILDWYHMNDDSVLEISAPYVHSLTLSVDHEESRKWRLVKIPSVVRANIDMRGFSYYTSAEMFSFIKKVFEDIQHVKKLELDKNCIQALSMLLREGWRLPQSCRDHLIINATTDKHSTPVILDLLDSSPNLKTLIINWTYPFFEGCDCCVPHTTYFEKYDTHSDLLHLKTVTMKCPTRADLIPFLTLVQILHRRAVVLEKMVIIKS